jgi:aldehyde:ferredoxin oxidoreductase
LQLRIANLRHIFNLREGINMLEWKVPGRMLGQPAFTEGPMAGITIDRNALTEGFLAAMKWGREDCQPNPERLQQLGLGYVGDWVKQR